MTGNVVLSQEAILDVLTKHVVLYVDMEGFPHTDIAVCTCGARIPEDDHPMHVTQFLMLRFGVTQ